MITFYIYGMLSLEVYNSLIYDLFAITKIRNGKWIAVESKTMKVVAVGDNVSEVESILQIKRKNKDITYVIPPEHTLSLTCKLIKFDYYLTDTYKKATVLSILLTAQKSTNRGFNYNHHQSRTPCIN